MGNAAIYLNPEAVDTTRPRLMGRHAAGEGFVRGYLRHSTAERFFFWNVAHRPAAELDALLARIAPVRRPVRHIDRQDRRLGLGAAGAVHLPQPQIAREAWRRRMADARTAYGISGITHTTASADIMDAICDLLTAPVEPWDALVCTSAAVRASVETQLEAMRADLEGRLQAQRLPEVRLHTIPLGVNVDDFRPDPADRAALRAELGLPDEAVVVLYVGRFNPQAKMNPLPMALALERAAQAAGRPVAWVQAGWAADAASRRAYADQCRALAPSVIHHVLDGRRADIRFRIWSLGDVFLSLSDNIQETFGLTPVEAMAAGIPCVVSDWDGYRDTVRHGVDGFRVATRAPRPGTGLDLAYRHANEWISYNQYVGAVAQTTAVDVGEAARALTDLIDNPDLRRRMGQAAQARAVQVFDWSAVIPQYEAMWAEMNAIRVKAGPVPQEPRGLAPNPRRPDPYVLFAGYPSQVLTDDTAVMLTPGKGWADCQTLFGLSIAATGGVALPTMLEFERLAQAIAEAPQTITVGQAVEGFAPVRREYARRGVLWLAKYDVVTLLPPPGSVTG